MLATSDDGNRKVGARERRRHEPADRPGPNDCYAHKERYLEATGRFDLPNGAFAEPCLTTWLRRHVPQRASRAGVARDSHVIAGSGNRTHASTLGRSQAAITSYPHAASSLPPTLRETLG